MRLRRPVFVAAALIAAALVGAGVGHAASRDMSQLTCGNFLASGEANMAVIIMWLRGYHAGKSGVIPYDAADPYAGRLGHFCGNHRAANLIDVSERILSDLDHGI
jgi:acid stress chaperone HdeB